MDGAQPAEVYPKCQQVVPDRTTDGTMMLAFHNLLYPYRDPEKMF